MPRSVSGEPSARRRLSRCRRNSRSIPPSFRSTRAGRTTPKRIDFALERCWPQDFVEKSYIAFDPHTPDRQHVELFAGHSDIVAVAIPNAGHPCAGYLAELGLLQQAVLAVADGLLDPEWLKREARARRKQSAHFHVALSMKARPLAWQLALARRAAEIASEHPICLVYYGGVLLRARQHAEAARLFERARRLAPGDRLVLHALAEAHRHAGDVERAAAVMTELAANGAVERDVLPEMARRLWRRALHQLGRLRAGGSAADR